MLRFKWPSDRMMSFLLDEKCVSVFQYEGSRCRRRRRKRRYFRQSLRGDSKAPVRKSLWDKFVSMKSLETTDKMLTFHQYNSVDNKVVTVYSNGVFRCQRPLTKQFANTILMLHKPNIKSFADVKGNEFDTLSSRL